MIGDGEITRDAIRDNLQATEIDGLGGPIKFSLAGIFRDHILYVL